MSIEGSKRPEFARQIGVFVGKVVAINPTGEQIKELYEMESAPEKEPEYTGEKDMEVPTHLDEAGQVIKVTKTVKFCRIDFYIRDTKTNKADKKAFFLWDSPFVKKDLSKQQFINSQGKTAWVDDVANLPMKFTHLLDKQGHALEDLSYHASIRGESDLIEFLDMWLAIDKKKAYDMSIDTGKLFRGNFRELQGLIESELASLIMGVKTVRAVEGPDGIQFWQDMWKKFLPAFAAKFFQQVDFTPEKLREISDKERMLKDKILAKSQIQQSDWLPNWEKFALEITDEDYGCKDSFSLKMAHDFDQETHYATRAATIDNQSNEY